MFAMTISAYGAAEDVFTESQLPKPEIRDDEVLVKIHATSVNPIEYKMREGYGRRVFSKKRRFEFPVALGNDVCGTIVSAGNKVHQFKTGDAVFAAPEVTGQGSYCEYRAIKASHCVPKPANLSFTEAATLPYVVMTTWSALITKTKLTPADYQGKKVLVHGGSGGIGSFAIQLLKAWGAEVTTTCSGDKAKAVKALGADRVINYKTEDFSKSLSDVDLVLDTVGGEQEAPSLSVLKKNANAHYVTLVFPALANIDQYGFFKGALKTIITLISKKRACKKQGINYNWGMFKSCPEALEHIRALVENGKIKAVVDHSYPLKQLAEAHNYVESGQATGKVAVTVTNEAA